MPRQAQIAPDVGDMPAAIAFQSEALTIVRRLDAADALLSVVRHLADILDDAGRHAEAAPLSAEMLALYRAGAKDDARRLWIEARDRYAALDELFREITGQPENPGVREADRRLAALDAD